MTHGIGVHQTGKYSVAVLTNLKADVHWSVKFCRHIVIELFWNLFLNSLHFRSVFGCLV